MQQEKRQAIRQRIGRLLYAELESDNASILLDLSENGCSFQAIAPVTQKQMRFAISVGDGRKIAGDAQVVWLDATRKIGGLHFLTDSPELKEQIQSWIQAAGHPESAVWSRAPLDSEAKRRRKQLLADARTPPEAPFGAMPATSSRQIENGRRPVLPNVQIEPHWMVQTLSAEGANFARTRRKALSLSLTVLLCIVVAAYRRDLGRVVMHFGARMAGEPEKQPPPRLSPSTEPSAVDQKPAARAAVVANPLEGSAQNVSSGTGQVASVADDPVPTTKPSVIQTADPPSDVPSLWTLVENGDTHAELALAEHYLYGEGVNQSCAQARVLLQAAARRGNDEAKRRLGELSRLGCR
jgi:hypothetical protein